jgi:AcrR family transcriptional regulator
MPTKVAAAPRRTRARRGEGDRLREEILGAAERLILERGNIDAVSIRAIADAVGVTPPSIYLHFADKDELVFAVCELRFREFRDAMNAASGESPDPTESLKLRGLAYVRFGQEHPEHFRVLFVARGEAEDLPPGIVESVSLLADTSQLTTDDLVRLAASPELPVGTAAFLDVVTAVRRCMDAGALPDGDPLAGAVSHWMIIHGYTTLRLAKPWFPFPPVEQVLDDAYELVRLRLTAGTEG